MASSAASGLLSRQLKLMQSDKDIPGISCGLIGSNVFEWEVMLMISDDCKYYGGTCHILLLCVNELKRVLMKKGIQEGFIALISYSRPSTHIYHPR